MTEDRNLLWLQVNGEKREVVDDLHLEGLIKLLNLTPERIAIELNHNVVRRADWAITVLKQDDRVEIVQFVGGGSSVEPYRPLESLNS